MNTPISHPPPTQVSTKRNQQDSCPDANLRFLAVECVDEVAAAGVSADLVPHRTFPGNRPTSSRFLPPRRPIVKCEGVRTERWKYVRYPETDPLSEQLFDLVCDPLERMNLAGEDSNRDMLVRLRKRCDAYRDELR